jgi:hypothetical protein
VLLTNPKEAQAEIYMARPCALSLEGLNLGSMASLRPSPIRFIDRTIATRKAEGDAAYHQALSR